MELDNKVRIRWMIRNDMRDVLEIEDKNNDLGWKEEDFLHALRQKNCVGLVSVVDEKIAGFCVYFLEKKHFEIANFGISQEYVLYGIGEVFINRLKMKLSPQRRKGFAVNVRETNLYTQLFLKDLGLKAVKVVKNYYDTEDAYRFVYSLKELNAKVNQ